MIAVTFALPQESTDFRRLLGNNQRIVCAHTGVGSAIAKRRMRDVLACESIEIVISSGFAGALKEDLPVGELVLGTNHSETSLVELALGLLPDARHIDLWTGPSVIFSPQQRAEVAQTTRAEAVDMETAAIAEACRERGIPLLSLRVISDSATEPFPAPPDVLFSIEKQRTDFGVLVPYLLRDPSAVGRLMRFGARVKKIRRRLTNALMTVLNSPVFLSEVDVLRRARHAPLHPRSAVRSAE